MAKLLNLPFIFSGVDSFELRIWHWEFAGGSSVIILRYSESQWNASKTVYFEHSNQIDSSIMYRINTPEDIGKVVQYLSSDSVLNLPTQKAIPGFVDNVSDGQDCKIEIASRLFYKTLSYHCPERYETEPNNKKFMELINYLNRYFNFYIPYCRK